MASLVTSCGGVEGADQPGERAEGPRTVERGGRIYTPISTTPEGCVLYNIRVEGGRAPAALVYQSVEGEFSYAPPEECVQRVPGREHGHRGTRQPPFSR